MHTSPTEAAPKSLNPPGADDLIRRWQASRDERARDRLVRIYWKHMLRHARGYANKWRLDEDDCMQEAGLGFIRALETYDFVSASLEAYAGLWYRAKIGRLRAQDVVTTSLNGLNNSGRVYRASTKLRKLLGRDATPAEIASEIRTIGPGQVIAALETMTMSRRIVSTAKMLGEDLTVGDLLRAPEGQRPDVLAEGKMDTERAREAIIAAASQLKPRYREVLAHRLVRGLTLEETGQLVGVTRERIRQIEAKVLLRLRQALASDVAAMDLIGRAPIA
ncbi:MAG: sigma-70 family RNA polymerase sigma factor [Devosia sp.]